MPPQLVDQGVAALALLAAVLTVLAGAFVFFFVRGMARSYRRGDWRFGRAPGRHRAT